MGASALIPGRIDLAKPGPHRRILIAVEIASVPIGLEEPIPFEAVHGTGDGSAAQTQQGRQRFHGWIAPVRVPVVMIEQGGRDALVGGWQFAQSDRLERDCEVTLAHEAVPFVTESACTRARA